MPHILINVFDPTIHNLLLELIPDDEFEISFVADCEHVYSFTLFSTPVNLVICEDVYCLRDMGAPLESYLNKFPSLPAIVISRRPNIADAVLATKAGAADYLPVDLLPTILLVRLRQLTEQSGRRATLNAVLVVGHLRIEPARMRVFCGEHEMTLSPTEYRILYLLAQAHQQAVSFEVVAMHLQGTPVPHKEARRLLSAHMSNLRAKLRLAGCGNPIINRRGYGYLLDMDSSQHESSPSEQPVAEVQPFIVASLDLDGIIRQITPDVYDILGYAPGELTGKSLWELVKLVDVDQDQEFPLTQVTTPNPTFNQILRFKTKHGGTVLLHVQSSTLVNQDGSLDSFVFIARRV